MGEARSRVLGDALPKLLRRGRTTGAKKLIETARVEDLAVLFRKLTERQRSVLFELIDDRTIRAELLAELDPPIAEDFLPGIANEELVALLQEMSGDDAADLLEHLDEERRDAILRSLQKAGEADLTELFHYDSETAAGIMTPEVFALPDETSARDAIAELQAHGDEFELSYYLYVIGTGGTLVGVCSLRELVTNPPETPLREIMEPDVVRVEMSTDQEEVARIVARYNLLAVPVVDPANKLVGTVTVDDIIDVIRLEATEDMLRMAGAGEALDPQGSAVSAAKARLPWLFASFIGGVSAAILIGAFETSIAKVVPLAAFIPIVLGMAGNVGIQSATIVTRGLALGRVDTTQLAAVLSKELVVAVICGVAYGLLLGVVAWVRYANSSQVESGLALGGTVGLAVSSGMIIAATFGAAIPIVFARLNVDPALASGPFVTTTVDVLGIAVYFGIATVLLGL